MKRVIKQLWYGFGFLSILLFIGLGIYYFYLRPVPTCFDNILNQDETEIDCGGATCIDCELKGLTLVTTDTRILPGGERRINLYTEVTNPAQNYNANFTYQLEVLSSIGGRLAVFDGTSFVEPGDTRHIVMPGVTVRESEVSRIEFEILEYEWESATTTETYPARIGERSAAVDGDEVHVAGTFFNAGPQPLRRVRITALLFDENRILVNASTVDLSDIGSFQERPFSVFFPESEELAEEVDLNEGQLFWEIIQ